MDKRKEELSKLKTYIEGVNNNLTMILGTLNWDRKQLLQSPALVTCRYDSNHKVPPDKTEEHEKECFLRHNGYSKDDLLPDPPDLESNTLVKHRKEDIEQIFANASRMDKLFKRVYMKIVQRSQLPRPIYIPMSFLNKGVGCHEAEPLSLERLQVCYSADERRAIHDAVVNAVPSCHDLTDLALLSGGDEKSDQVIKSRQEILLELRNMRRRRAKYRVAAKSRNYSDVLRDVIRTQMEHYSDSKTEMDPNRTMETYNNQRDTHNARRHNRTESRDTHRYDGKVVPKPINIKTERVDSTEINNRRDYNRERSDRLYRNETESRNRHDRVNDRSRERRNYDELERTQKYGEHSRKRRHDNESKEKRDVYEVSEERRKFKDREKEFSADKRSRKSHRDKDYVSEHEGPNDETNNRHREKHRERGYEDNRDKKYSDKDKKDRHRDRERSKERRRDKRDEDRSSDRIHIKQEKEDSVVRDETDAYDSNTSKDRSRKIKDKRHVRSYRDDRNYDSHSVDMKQEKYDRYHVPSNEIYDPNKKIKVEQ